MLRKNGDYSTAAATHRCSRRKVTVVAIKGPVKPDENDERKSAAQDLKDELMGVKNALKTIMADIKSEFQSLKTELQGMKMEIQSIKADIQSSKVELKAEITNVQAELKADINNVEVELEAVETTVQDIWTDMRDMNRGSEALSRAADQEDLRTASTTVSGNDGHLAEVSDRWTENSSGTQPALDSCAAPLKPYHKRGITVYITKEDSWQVHRKVYPEFFWWDLEQLCSRGLGLCALNNLNCVLTRLYDFTDGGSYALYCRDCNEQLVEQLAADILNNRPIEHYFLEQRTQDFIHEQALKLGSAVNVRSVSGWVKDQDGKKLLKIDALGAAEDTLLLGVAETCASLPSVQLATSRIRMLRLINGSGRGVKGYTGVYRMLDGLSHVKQCQVCLVIDELADGIGLAEVLAEAREWL